MDRTESTHPQGVPGWAETRNGTKLFYQVLDGPEPTVVFEAGLASTRSIWGLVQPNLGGVARSVVYDRAGLGRSPRTAGPRRLVNLAEDLSDLLDHLEANVGSVGGFVLVGHSWGGPIVRLTAASRPTRVRGLILVEPADEDCEIYYSLTDRSNRIQNAVVSAIGPDRSPKTDLWPDGEIPAASGSGRRTTRDVHVCGGGRANRRIAIDDSRPAGSAVTPAGPTGRPGDRDLGREECRSRGKGTSADDRGSSREG